MRKKKINKEPEFEYKQIQLWERWGFLGGGLRTHQEFIDWKADEKRLLRVLIALEKKKKLPKWEKKIKIAMAQSHYNCAEVFRSNARVFRRSGKMFAEVVDIQSIISELV